MPFYKNQLFSFCEHRNNTVFYSRKKTGYLGVKLVYESMNYCKNYIAHKITILCYKISWRGIKFQLKILH